MDDPERRKRQAMLGCAPAHRLLDIEQKADDGKVIDIDKKTGVTAPRKFEDYTVAVYAERSQEVSNSGFGMPIGVP